MSRAPRPPRVIAANGRVSAAAAAAAVAVFRRPIGVFFLDGRARLGEPTYNV